MASLPDGVRIPQVVLSVLSFDDSENAMIAAGATLLFYDHLLTLQRESRAIWSRELNAVTVLFLINRAIGVILGVMLILLLMDWETYINAVAISEFRLAALLVQRAVYGAFAILRVYAISGSSWRITIPVLLLNLTSLAPQIWEIAVIPHAFKDMITTELQDAQELVDSLHAPMAVYIFGAILADSLVLAVTWFYTWQTKRDASNLHIKVPITTLLLRDGTVYFTIIVSSELLYIILYLMEILPGIQYLIDVMVTIMTSRFILALRSLNSPEADSSDGDGGYPSLVASQTTMQFVQTAGAPVLSILDVDDDGGTAGMYAPLMGNDYDFNFA